MLIKKVLKLLLPPIFIKIRNILSFIVFNMNKHDGVVSTISQLPKTSESLIIIGNGPSFNVSIKKYKNQICLYNSIVVNHFCETEYYRELKPKFYLLADPAYFGDIDSYADWMKNRVIKFIAKLIDNTNWNICLIMPSSAQNSYFCEQIKKNPFITPFYYNNFDLVRYDENNKFNLWDKNLLRVPSQTCLNTCLWLGIYLRYKKIYLIGADTTWIENLHVDQKTNEVYTIDTHFYGEEKQYLYKDAAKKVPIKLHEELFSNYNALKLYWELKEYANYAKVDVYNASEYSLIDSFERKSI